MPYLAHQSRSNAKRASAQGAILNVVLATITILSSLLPCVLRHFLTHSTSALVRLGPLARQTTVLFRQQPCKGFHETPLFRKVQLHHERYKTEPYALASQRLDRALNDPTYHRKLLFSKWILSLCESRGANSPAILLSYQAVKSPYKIALGRSTPRPRRSSTRIVTRLLVKSALT